MNKESTSAQRRETADESKSLQLIEGARSGDRASFEELIALLYPKLKQMARILMAHERPGHTFDTGSELVQRLLFRLAGGDGSIFQAVHSEKELLRLLTTRMSDILIDYARASQARKRFNPKARLDFEDVKILESAESVDIDLVLTLRTALADLAEVDPVGAEAIKLRAFFGFTNDEAARIVGLPVGTFRKRLDAARAYLKCHIGSEAGN